MGISLEQINQEVDNEFGPFIVDDVPGGEVVLRNPLRLAKNERAQLAQLEADLKVAQGNLDAEAALATARNLVTLVAVGDGGKRLTKALGEDAAKLMYVLRLYSEATQLGEALRSDN